MKVMKWMPVVALMLGVASQGWAESSPDAQAPRSLRARLGLSDEQVERFEALRLEQRKAAVKRHADARALELELRALLTADVLDEQAVRAKTDALAQAHAARVRARVEGRLAMRKLLTPEQLERWRESGWRERHGRRHERRHERRFERDAADTSGPGDGGGKR
jgi:Spy/CpxP family protein refolding chaperone